MYHCHPCAENPHYTLRHCSVTFGLNSISMLFLVYLTSCHPAIFQPRDVLSTTGKSYTCDINRPEIKFQPLEKRWTFLRNDGLSTVS